MCFAGEEEIYEMDVEIQVKHETMNFRYVQYTTSLYH